MMPPVPVRVKGNGNYRDTIIIIIITKKYHDKSILSLSPNIHVITHALDEKSRFLE